MKRILEGMIFWCGFTLLAQEEFPEAIVDNSFLLEEAYNQDANVVQHISNYVYSRQTKDWQYVLTQEWPIVFLADQDKHQLSYAIPYVGVHAASESGVGDIQINYRYQLANDESKFFIAPRISIILPTGNEKKGLGSGNTSYQVGLPVSKRLHAHWAAHVNAGFTLTPGVKNGSKKETLKAFNVGGSIFYIVNANLNLFVEYSGSFADEWVGTMVENNATHFVNPGLSYGFNAGALQIVPGVSMPFQINGSNREKQLFVYLSLEHPFRK